MHIAMIMDNDRLVHEHVMLKRLSIGMIAQGVKLTRIVPDDIHAEPVLASERRMALAPRVEVAMKVLPWRRSSRAAMLAAALDRAMPDVIFALGRETWPIAMDLAELTDLPVALDIWSAELAHAAPRKRAARSIGGYITPTAPLASMLKQRVDSDLVSLVPMGVAIPSKPLQSARVAEQPVSAAIIGSGRDLQAYRGVLAALKHAVGALPTDTQIQVVLELRGPYEHEIWRELDRLNLHSVVSPIQDASLHRPLITRCDVLIVPECYGEVSSLPLDCMAAGMAVIAREDPFLDMLEENRTALLLHHDEMQRWSGPLTRCLSDLDSARRLGGAAREFASRRHSSSQHVARLIDTLDTIVRGESYAFVTENH